jgi:hypothetical protein
MLTLFSLILLLAVAAVVARLYSWSNEKTLVHWMPLPELHSIVVDIKIEQVSKPNFDDAFMAFTIPTLSSETPVRRVASVRRLHQTPRVEFQRVQKEVHILEEAFTPVEAIPTEAGSQWRRLQGSTTVPEFDSIKLAPIKVELLAATTLVALADQYQLPGVEVMVAEKAPIVDEVKTSQAASVDEEPEFFTYEAKEKAETKTAEAPKEAVAVGYSAPKEIEQQVSALPDSQPSVVESEEEDLLAFTYTAAPTPKQLPKIAQATTKPTIGRNSTPASSSNQEPETFQNGLMDSQPTGQAVVTISPLSVSTQVAALHHFELRAQDDGHSILQDNGTGSVTIRENTTGLGGSRSFSLLTRDHVPTNIDVPIVVGEMKLNIPALSQDYLASYEVQPGEKSLGFLLVELDELTEAVSVDGLKAKTILLDENFRQVTEGNQQYVLLSGVEVGNRLVTFTRTDGKKSTRILHVHESEVTFDPNLYREREDIVLTLGEEGVLAQSQRPLSISGNDVSMTFTGEKAQKVAPSVYRLRPAPLPLGARHYVTLTHNKEEIFVGVEKSLTVDVPSEELIGAVIEKFKLQGNASACLIQVNLDKPAKRYEVLAESYNKSHVSYGLVLDKDGAFYESLGSDSRRIFVMSENQGGDAQGDNSKVNIRIEYQDGSHRNFASFCSPNSYLVEQL